MEGSTARGEEEEEGRFPSLREWVEGREGLYQARRGVLEGVCRWVQVQVQMQVQVLTTCREEGVGNLTSNSSVADLINHYTHMDKGGSTHLQPNSSLRCQVS